MMFMSQCRLQTRPVKPLSPVTGNRTRVGEATVNPTASVC